MHNLCHKLNYSAKHDGDDDGDDDGNDDDFISDSPSLIVLATGRTVDGIDPDGTQ